MANTRTYKNGVKIGNWYENMCLEEDLKRKYMEKRERGELTIQKIDYLKYNILRPVDISVTYDGFLHFGDSVMLVHVGGGENCYLALNINTDIYGLITAPVPGLKGPCGVTAGRAQPCTRTTFVITSVDGSPEGSPLCYNQSFALKTTGFAAGFFLKSEVKSFLKSAKLSRLQDVYLDSDNSFLSRWKMLYFNPQERFENEGCPVPANVKVLIVHCSTNQALAALTNHVLWTLFGNEYEVAAQTFLDSHKAEEAQNHWLVYAPYPPEKEPDPFTNALAFADNAELPTEKEILGAAGLPPPAGQYQGVAVGSVKKNSERELK